jgi:hypothetical protein
MVGDLRPQDLFGLEVAILWRALGAQAQAHPDVVGEVELLTRGAGDEVRALALLDVNVTVVAAMWLISRD